MERVEHNLYTIRFKRMVQVIHIVAVVEDEDGQEKELIVDSIHRPLPVPYNEQM